MPGIVGGNAKTEHSRADDGATDPLRRLALLKTGALQTAILNSANFSSIATDEKGVIQVFNVGAERMLGFAAAEVIDKLTPADISDPLELIARARALSVEHSTVIRPGFDALVFRASRGIEDVYELTYLRKGGARLPAMVAVSALRDGSGAIIGYLLMGTDNSARKRAEAEQDKLDQRLRDQQFYTRSLIESNLDALIATDPQGRITDVNRQMEILAGRTRDELIGTAFKDCFTDPARAESGMHQVLASNKLTDFELVACKRSGAGTPVSYNAITFHDRDGRLQGVFAAARDITERKRLDQVLEDKHVELSNARVVAEKANLAKSDFLSCMSHELRSPLNAILGFAQLVETGSPPPTPAQKESIDQILQAGWYLLELINEILDLALIESGKVSMSCEPISLRDLLDDCAAMIEPQARQGGIRVRFPQLEGEWFVHADRTRVKQVVINLLSNAIKYNRVGGSVEVRCGTAGAERTRISFQDCGEGLDAAKLAQLFQPFNRLGQEAGSVEGTGIGLVVSQRLMELMDGAIGAESTVGVGSLFWIDLPSTQALQLGADTLDAPRAVASVDAAAGETHTLLCVEDNPANLLLVERLLARRPEFRLVSARDGQRGIEMARTCHPDVILMDINLPGISGIAAMRALAHDPRTARIPVIALSANAMARDVERGLAEGFFKYLTKPIKVVEFMAALDAALLHARAAVEGPRPGEAA
ncbi:MAG: PAS domain S-box protein [Burkholderiales bacterium]|nr:PAS domain S-box protein [Burkholderiales bacterium]